MNNQKFPNKLDVICYYGLIKYVPVMADKYVLMIISFKISMVIIKKFIKTKICYFMKRIKIKNNYYIQLLSSHKYNI